MENAPKVEGASSGTSALSAGFGGELQSAEATAAGLKFCCGKEERLTCEIAALRNVVQAAMSAGCAEAFDAWNYHFPENKMEPRKARTTLCWSCNTVYPIADMQCQSCGATNANRDPETAATEVRAKRFDRGGQRNENNEGDPL